MAYSKTTWTEAVAITDTRLNNQEDGIESAETYIDAQVAAANQNISDAKTPIAAAITNKGVTASDSEAFSSLATKIGQINAIKSVQQGLFQFASAESGTSKNITITSVDTSKSIIIAFKVGGHSENARRSEFRFSFSNSTTIVAERYSATSPGADVEYVYTVIEFEDWVSVQTGTDSGSTNITISSVDTSMSFAVCTRLLSSSVVTGNIGARITSTTNLRLAGSYLSTSSTRWFVVDLSTS